MFIPVYAGKHDDQHTQETINLTPKSLNLADIQVETLKPINLQKVVIVPGEIVSDRDNSAIIAPRIQAQVVKRLVNVGQQVTKGQPLVELSSVEVADAQAQLLINANEWSRMKTLGTKIVTKKTYEETQIKFQQSFAKLLAYGLTTQQIQNFIESKAAHKADGNFTLLSPIDGTVAEADIVLGQMLNPGTKIFEITDESRLWVNALLSADNSDNIQIGNAAVVKTGKKSVQGTVIQVHHQLDTITRTQIVRILIPNRDDKFHAGEFVTCHIAIGTKGNVLTLPMDAILRSEDGDNFVFVETQPGKFMAKEIQVRYRQNGKAIISGLEQGTKVVVKGAFFIQSQALKAGFSTHNH